MKTIILIFTFCLLPFTLLSQVDTATFEFKANGSDGKYTMLQNKVEYLGKSAGQIVTPLQFDVSAVDTSKWLFIPIGSDGTYRLVENKETFMGMDSGTVRAQVVSGITSIGTATTSSGTATLNTLAGIVTTDNVNMNTSAVITVNNSYVKSTSLIIYSVQYLEPNDLKTDQVVTHGIIQKEPGVFQIKFVSEIGYSGEVVLYFQIIN